MKQSPLHDRHLARNAKMADFGGWLMPIEYPGAGVIAEHTAVRERVGIFDVSHLGKASVKGEGAVEFYKKNGYTIVEKSYVLFDCIQHYLMKKCV
jgi:aminomethyltransferase